MVPSHLAGKAGLSQSQVQIADKYGSGFPANVEGLHHLHCLNLLRQALYYNFDYYHDKGEGAFKNDDRILMVHVSMYPLPSSNSIPKKTRGIELRMSSTLPRYITPTVDVHSRYRCARPDLVEQTRANGVCGFQYATQVQEFRCCEAVGF